MTVVNKVQILFSIFIISFSVNCQGQDLEQRILGKWDAQEEIVEGLENKTIEGKELTIDLSIVFSEEKLNLIENGMVFNDISYDIIEESEKSILIFGNRKYFIDKLNEEELVLLEDKILSSRILFRKNNQ